MQGEAQGHHMGVELAELQGGSLFGKRVQVHLEKIYGELAVDVVELVFVFAVVFLQILFVNLFEVVQVVGALGIDTFVEDKVFAVLFGNQRMVAVGTAQLHGRKTAVLWGEPGITYFAEYLSFGTIVFVEVWHRRITAWTGAVFGDIAFRTAVYGLDLLPIAFLDIGDELLVSPALTEVSDKW